jgi:hypothetical protein
MKRLLLILFLPFFLVSIPATIHADVSVVQDSCVTVGTPPFANVWTYFSVVNFSLPVAVCDLHFIPEPQPPDSGCVMLDLVSPGPDPGIPGSAGWSGALRPDGGADWWANTPADCILPGTIRRGFAFYLDPAFCCYIVRFTDATGAVIHEQEECFTCQKVPVDERSWGYIKQLYYE